MDYPFIGMLQAFGFNWAPQDYALCSGQLIAVQENPALFALLGTFYGGNGQVNFGLPDMRGRLANGQGPLWPNGNNYQIGLAHGVEEVTLSTIQMPQHSHAAEFFSSGSGSGETIEASTSTGSLPSPSLGSFMGGGGLGISNPRYVPPAQAGMTVALGGISGGSGGTGTVTVGDRGNSTHFDIRQPYLVVNWAIALQGLFPSRN